LQKVTLGTTLDELPLLWNWKKLTYDETGGEGIRLVIFGDSWVDESLDAEAGKGRSWVEVLCEAVSGVSCL
jgi:hypothetical protein